MMTDLAIYLMMTIAFAVAPLRIEGTYAYKDTTNINLQTLGLGILILTNKSETMQKKEQQ